MTDTTTDDVEEKARALGWKSAEEWVGDTTNHMPAEKYLETQEKLLAKADAAAQKRISALNGDVRELKQTIADLGDHLRKADQRALERARQEIQGRMDAAVEENDPDAYKRAKSDLGALEKEVDAAAEAAKEKPKPESVPNAVTPEAQALFDDFQAANDWYGPDGDPKATIFANRMAKEVAESGFTGKKFYDVLRDMVKDEFPALFEGGGKADGNRRRAPAVEGAGGSGGGKKTLWDQVDQEGKDTFKRFVKQGLFKDTKEDREKYASDWGAEA